MGSVDGAGWFEFGSVGVENDVDGCGDVVFGHVEGSDDVHVGEFGTDDGSDGGEVVIGDLAPHRNPNPKPPNSVQFGKGRRKL